jgi:hypothetical protein
LNEDEINAFWDGGFGFREGNAPRWSERNAKMVGAEAGEFHEV